MNLLDVYSLLSKQEITVAEAAKAFGFTERDMKFRLTHYGARLPLLLSVLDRIKEDTISRGEAADVLSVTPREVNQLMHNWHIKRPLKAYLIERSTSKVKWEIRKKFAVDFIAGYGTLADAAEGANVSVRQMRRWVSDLLDKHYKMVFKDLKELTLKRRRRLAAEIEEAEGLELAKQQVLQAIADGKRSLGEEALERVMARKARRERSVQGRPTDHDR